MEELGTAVLEGYAGARPPALRLAAECAAELIRLAPRSFRERRLEWDAELEAMIERVEEVIQGATWGAPFVSTPSPLAGTPHVPVDDPTGAAYDAALPFLARALDLSASPVSCATISRKDPAT